jgi:putative tryptophan/tyrosine transport system substrate-binding protein
VAACGPRSAADEPVVGFLSSQSPDNYAPFPEAFKQGLKEQGFVDGENVTIEYRWARGQLDLIPALAARSGPLESRCHRRYGWRGGGSRRQIGNNIATYFPAILARNRPDCSFGLIYLRARRSDCILSNGWPNSCRLCISKVRT